MNCFKLNVLVAGCMLAGSVNAATIIDLRHEPANYLYSFMATKSAVALSPIRTDVDFNQVSHERLQQTYSGYPVWGATPIVHAASKQSLQQTNSMDGKIFQGLEKDLANFNMDLLSTAQQEKALQLAKATFSEQAKHSYPMMEEESIQTIVYLDAKNQAHFGFLTSFFVDDDATGAHRPTMIIDAVTLRIHKQWDQVMTADANATNIKAGGIGGNEKTGDIAFDDSLSNFFSLDMQSTKKTSAGKSQLSCALQNADILVTQTRRQQPISGNCDPLPGMHNNLPWLSHDNNGTRWLDDGINGGFSPSLDALYSATVVKKLYQDWYHIPVLTVDGTKPMKLVMRVHYGRNFANAFWDGKKMNFGDGNKTLYPLTSMDVTAHEISHGFTQQHSNIDTSNNQMAALHESFSDMAAMAAQYYLTHTNTWDLGRSIFKDDHAIRYLDDPKKDGQSIDNMRDYASDTDPHLVAGITNKAFYLLANTPDWDTQKAFNVMVKANMHYWSSSTASLNEVACGVISATKDYGYSVADVKAAFDQVGIDTKRC